MKLIYLATTGKHFPKTYHDLWWVIWEVVVHAATVSSISPWQFVGENTCGVYLQAKIGHSYMRTSLLSCAKQNKNAHAYELPCTITQKNKVSHQRRKPLQLDLVCRHSYVSEGSRSRWSVLSCCEDAVHFLTYISISSNSRDSHLISSAGIQTRHYLLQVHTGRMGLQV